MMQAAIDSAKATMNGKTEKEEDVTWEFPHTLVFESKKTKGLDEYGKLAKDLIAHDKTDDQIIALCADPDGMKSVVKRDEDELKESIKLLVEGMTAMGGDMFGCVTKLFERFYTGHGEENINDKILKKHVERHSGVQDYIGTTKELIRTKLWSDNCQGVMANLTFVNSVKGWNLGEIMNNCNTSSDKNNPKYDYDKMLDTLPLYVRFQELIYPKFISGNDLTNGLALAIHDFWAVKIEIVNYVLNYSKKSYTGTYRLTIHDNFGLDDDDMRAHPAPNGADWFERKWADIIDPANYAMFQSWYVLQHRTHDLNNGTYKPFINTIVMDSEFHGDVPGKWHGAMEEGVRKARGY